MPHSLSAHYSNCNEYYYAYQKCELEHPIGRYLDYCQKYRRQMIICCKKERERSRRENFVQGMKRRQLATNTEKSAERRE